MKRKKNSIFFIIGQFFKNIFTKKSKIRTLNPAKEEIDTKKEFFNIYNKLKNKEISIKDVKEEDLKKINQLLEEEIKLNKKEYEKETNEIAEAKKYINEYEIKINKLKTELQFKKNY